MQRTTLPRPRPESFTSPLHSPAVASRIGVWLAICFGVAFATGLFSHWAQATTWWLPFPTGPAWLYRVTQGLHVASGTAAVPLLLVKLWTVYPRLFEALPRRGARRLLGATLERGSIGVLVASALFLLATGTLNTSQWYPWSFSFRSTHHAVAWIAVGALVVHVAVKLPMIRRALGTDIDSRAQDRPSTADPATGHGLSRRGLVRVGLLGAGAAVLTTAGATVPWLRSLSVFAVRDGDGPQGVPVNQSASEADVEERAVDPAYALTLASGARTVTVSRAELAAMPQRTATLPIACVEGWSASATWTGVRVRDLLDLVDAPAGSDVTVTSLQPSGPYRSSLLQGSFTDHDDTLLALRLGGEDLSLDHGYPARLIAPDRPGVLQTKWVERIEVV